MSETGDDCSQHARVESKLKVSKSQNQNLKSPKNVQECNQLHWQFDLCMCGPVHV